MTWKKPLLISITLTLLILVSSPSALTQWVRVDKPPAKGMRVSGNTVDIENITADKEKPITNSPFTIIDCQQELKYALRKANNILIQLIPTKEGYITFITDDRCSCKGCPILAIKESYKRYKECKKKTDREDLDYIQKVLETCK